MRKLLPVALVSAAPRFVLLAPTAGAQTPAGEAGPPAPPVRKIPGINQADLFPRGCVDCHVNRPEMNLDVRLSTLMRQWNQQVQPPLLAKVQAAAAPAVALKGRHPVVTRALDDIPAGSLTCHGKASKVGPPFAQMIHRLHLSGGEQNHFMTLFQGECTHCHKLDAATGRWSLPSGPEKESTPGNLPRWRRNRHAHRDAREVGPAHSGKRWHRAAVASHGIGRRGHGQRVRE